MRRADKEFLNTQIENLKESAHECFATLLMQIDYLNMKLAQMVRLGYCLVISISINILKQNNNQS